MSAADPRSATTTRVGDGPSSPGARYVPAAGRRALTGLYDPAMALTMREHVWRPVLQARVLAGLPPCGRVVDVGCGTGTAAIAIAAAAPEVAVIGVDGDPGALARARAKPGAERVQWLDGLAHLLPLKAGTVDAVVMTLLLHHLDPNGKRRALGEAVRILRAGGRLYIADWGPASGMLRASFFALRLIDGLANTRDHAAGRLSDYLHNAGLTAVTRYGRLRTAWGNLELLTATRASDGGLSSNGMRRE